MKYNKILSLTIIFFASTGVFSQKHGGDTLYFEYDNTYLEKRFKEKPNFLFIKDTGNDGEYFFFEVISEFSNKTSKKTLNLKKYIRKSDFYNSEKKIKLNDYDLYNHFKKFTIYIVKSENCKSRYALVKPMVVIE